VNAHGIDVNTQPITENVVARQMAEVMRKIQTISTRGEKYRELFDDLVALEAYRRTLPEVESVISKCESPLEELFYKTYLGCSPVGEIRQQLHGLVVQHAVTVNGKNYRLDFALPSKKIAFEMDGYTYHGKERKDFNRDRRRDLDLKLSGWEVHRFDGDMIREDVVHVLAIAAKLAQARVVR
jgi:very-short-patch-repair endonuclease